MLTSASQRETHVRDGEQAPQISETFASSLRPTRSGEAMEPMTRTGIGMVVARTERTMTTNTSGSSMASPSTTHKGGTRVRVVRRRWWHLVLPHLRWGSGCSYRMRHVQQPEQRQLLAAHTYERRPPHELLPVDV
mmetsp:Transcript_33250/g.87469  ORF Transcript_33250/g.87469 Transcript_33250/m.87469 type:complete len:135 (+) Transcript_33250:569-973(+)